MLYLCSSHHDMCSGMRAVNKFDHLAKLVIAHPNHQDMHAGICEPDIWP